MGPILSPTKKPSCGFQSYAPYENIGGFCLSVAFGGQRESLTPRVTYWEPLKWVQKNSCRGRRLRPWSNSFAVQPSRRPWRSKRALSPPSGSGTRLVRFCSWLADRASKPRKILRSRGLWQAADAGSPDTEATNAESPDTGIEDTGAEV